MFLVICEITSNTISMCLPITELNCSGLKQNCQVESLKVELEGNLTPYQLFPGSLVLHLGSFWSFHYERIWPKENQVSQLLSSSISVIHGGNLSESSNFGFWFLPSNQN